jgi:hypothetical protein
MDKSIAIQSTIDNTCTSGDGVAVAGVSSGVLPAPLSGTTVCVFRVNQSYLTWLNMVSLELTNICRCAESLQTMLNKKVK